MKERLRFLPRLRFHVICHGPKSLAIEARGPRQFVGERVDHRAWRLPKHLNADVENPALYYIDSFRTAGRNGIRFEHGAAVLPAPDGAEYPFCYRYELAPRSGTFTHWQQGRTLASFDWTDGGARPRTAIARSPSFGVVPGLRFLVPHARRRESAMYRWYRESGGLG